MCGQPLRPRALIGRHGAGPRPGTRAARRAAPPAQPRLRCALGVAAASAPRAPAPRHTAPPPAPTGCVGRSGAPPRPERPVSADAAPPGPSALHSATPTSVGDGQGRGGWGAADTSPVRQPTEILELSTQDALVCSGPLRSRASVKWVEFCQGKLRENLYSFSTAPTGAPWAASFGRRGFSLLGLAVPGSSHPLPTAAPNNVPTWLLPTRPAPLLPSGLWPSSQWPNGGGRTCGPDRDSPPFTAGAQQGSVSPAAPVLRPSTPSGGAAGTKESETAGRLSRTEAGVGVLLREGEPRSRFSPLRFHPPSCPLLPPPHTAWGRGTSGRGGWC